MKLSRSSAGIYVPDAVPLVEATGRVTHLGIGAHHDDLEFMAFHGILACYQNATRWFGGVTCTDGSGSVRVGPYENLGDEELKAVRSREQNEAAVLGQYGVMVQLDHPSHVVKEANGPDLKEDLKTVLAATRPEIVYTHNPADKHDTHIGVVVAVLQALRETPPRDRPGKVWGCEVWRGLDWMPDADKVVMDVSAHRELASALNGIFASQIAGGKRYDFATLGRRAANATFFDPRATDQAGQVIFGMDLSPLVHDDSLDPVAFVDRFIMHFRRDVIASLSRRLGVP